MPAASGGDGHVVPVTGRPLGDAVAAQVLVDMRHLLGGDAIGQVQGRVAAVGLRAPHVHRLQQVLAVQHVDLWRRGGGAFFFLAFYSATRMVRFLTERGLTCTMISLFLALLRSWSSSPKHRVTVGSGAGS